MFVNPLPSPEKAEADTNPLELILLAVIPPVTLRLSDTPISVLPCDWKVSANIVPLALIFPEAVISPLIIRSPETVILPWISILPVF